MSAKLTIEEMRRIAESRGGKCLSNFYTNHKTKLKWQCAKGHVWETIPDSVKRGSWCSRCANSASKLTIEEMHKLAKSRGGKCLSNNYVSGKTKLKWQCEKGHVWEAKPSGIKFGYWCPVCNSDSKKLTIVEMRRIAVSRGGKCLSDKYVGSGTKLKWQCANGHVWETTPSIIRSGSWCPECNFDSMKLSMTKMHELAKSRGGKCLSSQYFNNSTKLKWLCANGHVWEAVPSSVRAGTWCPTCTSGTGERITQKIFESIFLRKFPKVKLPWLLNSKGNKMEIDGYCDELRVGFEYQGEQHYQSVPFFKNTDFKSRSREDMRKRETCKKHGVVLIDIPFYVGYKDLQNFIISECGKNHINPPNKKLVKIEELEVFYPQDLKQMHELAKSRGGKCLSSQYFNNSTKLKWQCANGHVWEAVPSSISMGTWCKECYRGLRGNSQRSNIEQMRKLAKSRGGKCLSNQYFNSNTKLKWQCANGHVWEAISGRVKTGAWCPVCAGNQKLTIEKMHKLAESRGGKCLSDEYVNSATKLKWQCAKGHVWEAVPNSISMGSWCLICSGSKKLTIEEMRKLAKSRGGKCLSSRYINGKTKLKWRCVKGHVWEAAPQKIKFGTWCPKCSNTMRLTIREMHKIAKLFGGKCLSNQYFNSNTKLKWQCAKGHVWEAAPSNIKAGHWCQKCHSSTYSKKPIVAIRKARIAQLI